MALFLRLQATWTGGAVGQGVTTLAVGSATSWTTTQVDSARSARNIFFSGIEGYIPDEVTINIPQTQMLVDEETGLNVLEMVGPTAIASRVGDSTGSYANGVGASIMWSTESIVNGRRVRGRTFLVPLDAGIYDVDGSLDAAFVSAMNTSASGLLSNLGGVNGGLQVYSRPREASAGPPPVAARVGALHSVVAGSCADKPSWLRTRRD